MDLPVTTIDPAADHFGQWGYLVVWAVVLMVLLVFTPL